MGFLEFSDSRKPNVGEKTRGDHKGMASGM